MKTDHTRTRRPRSVQNQGTEPEDQNDSRDANLDRTIEDTFPASDPPSSIPDPADQPDDPRDPRDEP